MCFVRVCVCVWYVFVGGTVWRFCTQDVDEKKIKLQIPETVILNDRAEPEAWYFTSKVRSGLVQRYICS